MAAYLVDASGNGRDAQRADPLVSGWVWKWVVSRVATRVVVTDRLWAGSTAARKGTWMDGY